MIKDEEILEMNLLVWLNSVQFSLFSTFTITCRSFFVFLEMSSRCLHRFRYYHIKSILTAVKYKTTGKSS